MTSKNLYLGTLAIWFVLCLSHYLLKTHLVLSGPHDDDTYAYTWGFQALAFLVFRLPWWLLALLIVMFVEYLIFPRERTRSA